MGGVAVGMGAGVGAAHGVGGVGGGFGGLGDAGAGGGGSHAGDGGGGRGVVVPVELLAAQQGDHGADDGHEGGGGEHDRQAVVERRGYQVREELLARQHRDVVGRQFLE